MSRGDPRGSAAPRIAFEKQVVIVVTKESLRAPEKSSTEELSRVHCEVTIFTKGPKDTAW